MEDRVRSAATHLESLYGRIAEIRMRDLPICNTRLRVEAVGFTSWDGHVIGVLVTPWCMNLVLMPGPDDDWSDLAGGAVSTWELPSGTYEFNPCLFDDALLHLTAPLFSSVQDFPDQRTARAIAREVMQSLLRPPEIQHQQASGDEDDQCGDALMVKPLSRRRLLRRVALMES